jgi:hypothetical protein
MNKIRPIVYVLERRTSSHPSIHPSIHPHITEKNREAERQQSKNNFLDLGRLKTRKSDLFPITALPNIPYERN